MVCRLFAVVIQQKIRIESLVICKQSNRDELGRFFYSNKAINDGYIINRPHTDFFLIDIMQVLTSKLRRLYVDYRLLQTELKTRDENGHLEIDWYLNRFVQIEQLQLDNFRSGPSLFELKLPQLRILFVKSCTSEPVTESDEKLRIVCPALSVFKATGPLSEYEFARPDQIKDLDLQRFEGSLSRFVSLERLFIHDGDSITDDFVGYFEQLEELHLRRIHMQNISQLFKQRNQLGARFAIYLMGVRIDTPAEIDLHYPNNPTELNVEDQAVILGDRQKSFARSLAWIEELNYSETLKLVDNSANLWSEFFRNLVNIRCLYIIERELKLNELLLLQFIKCCKVLSHLQFQNVTLETEFFDELHLFCNYISTISILSHTKLIRQEFILKHRYLREFYICDYLEIETVSKAFNLPNILTFGFQYQDNRMMISRALDRTFTLTIDADETREVISFDQIPQLLDILMHRT